VATTWTSSERSASSAVAISGSSAWNSLEAVTSTNGSSISSSQAGASDAGSQRPGPTMRQDGGSLSPLISNGSAVK
jgi:hypothetical protein